MKKFFIAMFLVVGTAYASDVDQSVKDNSDLVKTDKKVAQIVNDNAEIIKIGEDVGLNEKFIILNDNRIIYNCYADNKVVKPSDFVCYTIPGIKQN